jgi:hypothetical protein
VFPQPTAAAWNTTPVNPAALAYLVGWIASRALASKGSGVLKILFTSASICRPLIGLISKRCFSAVARNSAFLSLVSNEARKAGSRSVGRPGGVR